MRKLDWLAAPLLAAMVAGAAMPAMAYPTPERAEQIRVEIDRLQQAIEHNDWHGNLNDRQVWRLRQDVKDLRSKFRMYNRDGLSDREVQYLQDQIHYVRDRMHFDRNRNAYDRGE